MLVENWYDRLLCLDCDGEDLCDTCSPAGEWVTVVNRFSGELDCMDCSYSDPFACEAHITESTHWEPEVHQESAASKAYRAEAKAEELARKRVGSVFVAPFTCPSCEKFIDDILRPLVHAKKTPSGVFLCVDCAVGEVMWTNRQMADLHGPWWRKVLETGQSWTPWYHVPPPGWEFGVDRPYHWEKWHGHFFEWVPNDLYDPSEAQGLSLDNAAKWPGYWREIANPFRKAGVDTRFTGYLKHWVRELHNSGEPYEA